MLGSLGGPELLIILFIVLIIFGAGKIGSVGSELGKGIREFKRATSGEYDKDKTEAAEEASETAS
ncbi:MAG: twin-arginine translocase TatA/TatE family subunit [Chloroflexi bacterium]|nr:twin-arginine translocase TatA/TatE family subunit [Chloroflexota bacterium]